MLLEVHKARTTDARLTGTHQFGQLGLDVGVEDVPPTTEVVLGVSLKRSGHGLTLSVELDVPGLCSTDEVNDLDSVAVAGT